MKNNEFESESEEFESLDIVLQYLLCFAAFSLSPVSREDLAEHLELEQDLENLSTDKIDGAFKSLEVSDYVEVSTGNETKLYQIKELYKEFLKKRLNSLSK